MSLLQPLEGNPKILRNPYLHNDLRVAIVSSTFIAGSVSTCFILRLMIRASLYARSNSCNLFQRLVLIRTVTLLDVLSKIDSISLILIFNGCKDTEKTKLCKIFCGFYVNIS